MAWDDSTVIELVDVVDGEGVPESLTIGEGKIVVVGINRVSVTSVVSVMIFGPGEISVVCVISRLGFCALQAARNIIIQTT